MKPASQFTARKKRFPLTDYFLQSDFGRWRGYWSPSDDESNRFHEFSRKYLLESAREQNKEMIVFGLVLLTAAWPVIYMVISIVQLLLKGRPID